MSQSTKTATLLSGISQSNKALFHRVRFTAGDPMSLIEVEGPNGTSESLLIIRDIEAERARETCPVDRVAVYEDFEIEGGLSGDREIRVAQATAECLVRAGVTSVRADRTLSLLVVDELRSRGLAVSCDRDLGVLDRRMKTAEEIEHLRTAQGITENAIRMACTMIARAGVLPSGELEDPESAGLPLTAMRVMRKLDEFLDTRGCVSPMHIVACGPQGADCHARGAGTLRTGQPIIIDVFPTHRDSGYHGDCTRCVVHGPSDAIPEKVAHMHAVVAEAKAAAIAACKPGATGEDVHHATLSVLKKYGYERGLPPSGAFGATEPTGFCSMAHGTGHGIGLEVHEPPLLDEKAGPLVVGDALTVEPGLYAPGLGGIRLEDMVIVTKTGCENLNTLQEGLSWA
ncbi:MAG: Xaa-Pro aminopeptidase [Phycisphaerales bacterium]|jgi:Xaa-Pro aminopeptidase